MIAPRRSNCIVWAWRRWRANPGSALLIRLSYRTRRLFHVEWMPATTLRKIADEVVGYSPIDRRKTLLGKLLHALWFKGHVISDAEDLKRAQSRGSPT